MMINIRTARQGDTDALARLASQLGYPSDAERIGVRLNTIMQTPDNIVLVAEIPDEGVVGWVHAFIARRVESEPFAELGGLVVDEHSRGQRIGKGLVEACENWAQQHHVASMRVRTNTIRKDTHRFYEALGYLCSKEQRVYAKTIRAARQES